MTTYTVLRWDDGYGFDLAAQLRARPGFTAVVAEQLPGMATGPAVRQVEQSLGDGFEIWVRPCDDGPYGVLYEVTATYLSEPTDPTPKD